MLGSPSLDERKEGKRNPGFHAGLCSLISFSTLFILPWYLFYQLYPLLAGIFIPEASGFWQVSGLAHGSFCPSSLNSTFSDVLSYRAVSIWFIWQG